MAGCTCTRPGMRTWTKERKIYLAVGILACAVGVFLIAFTR
ncbi:hypothetical protein ARZXY2_2899 [Arthrobacter sp. ZXY-2]|nr:hypothetical protein ARZXY2_2899 [Arthrobacter sp. ZXY-2]